MNASRVLGPYIVEAPSYRWTCGTRFSGSGAAGVRASVRQCRDQLQEWRTVWLIQDRASHERAQMAACGAAQNVYILSAERLLTPYSCLVVM